MVRLPRKLSVLMLVAVAGQAAACGDGYYKDSLGLCLPYDKTVGNAVNPVQAISNAVLIAQGIAEGNGDKLKQGIGGMILHTQCAVACEAIAANVVPQLSPEQLKQIVGEGFIVFTATGDPLLTIIDTTAQVARQLEVNRNTDQGPLPVPPPPAPRPKMQYTATAKCLGQHIATQKTVAGWVDPPQFRSNNVDYTFPSVDLRKDDLITITAPECGAWNNPGSGYKMLTSATIVYDRADVLPGGPAQMKIFITGTQATAAEGATALAK